MERTAPCPPLDNRLRIETPEGIDLWLRPAGIIPRALAFAIDLLIRAAVLIALVSLLAPLRQLGTGLLLIVLFLLNWWYMVLFEVFNQGRSPGKQLLKLRVVHDDGTPIGWANSLLRNLLRFVDMLPGFYVLGLTCSLLHPHFKRLGDLAAGTLVVYQEVKIERPALPEADIQQAPFDLTLDEQRAVLAFAERSAQLSVARREELAALLAPALHEPHNPSLTLYGIARSVTGSL